MDDHKKEISKREEELSKKLYTYDSKGEIVFIKPLNNDNMSKNYNFESKVNTKKPVHACKGIYSFSKVKRSDKAKLKPSASVEITEPDS